MENLNVGLGLLRSGNRAENYKQRRMGQCYSYQQYQWRNIQEVESFSGNPFAEFQTEIL